MRPAQVPVPRIASLPGAWIAQWLELQARRRQSRFGPVGQQSRAVGGHEVRHGAPLPHVPVQPEPAIHRVNHPFAARCELAIGGAGLGV